MSHARNRNVVGALGVALADRLVRAGAAGSAAEALVSLASARGGGSIDALARQVGLTHSGAVRLVDRLAREGMVERRTAGDRRVTALVLTPEGRRTARRILERRAFELDGVLSLLTEGQQDALARLAERLLARIGETTGEPDRLCRLCDHDACGHERGTCPVTVGAAGGGTP